MIHSAQNRKRPHSGYLYIAVLFTSLMVAASIAASLSLSTTKARAGVDRGNVLRARQLAESELHRIASYMQQPTSTQTSAWRNQPDLVSGQFSPWRSISVQSLGGATSPLSELNAQVRHCFLATEDSQLNDPTSHCVVVVHAMVEKAEYAVQAELEPTQPPLRMLDYSVTVWNDIEFYNDGSLSTERAVQVGSNCLGGQDNLLTTPRLECSGTVQVVRRGPLAAASLESLPHNVVDLYVARGEQIQRSALTRVGGSHRIRRSLLSAADNPFGEPSSEAIYWIDAEGHEIQISDSRIVATLAIKNASLITINGGIVWQAPGDAAAILVSDSPIQFASLASNLDESFSNANYNPTSTPYRGQSNENTSDRYPRSLAGIIYSSNHIEFSAPDGGEHLRIQGVVIADSLRINGPVSINHLDELRGAAPLGFTNLVPMRFVHGSLRRIVSPQ